MTRDTPLAQCPSCDTYLLGVSWSEYIDHLADHDNLAGRIAREMVRDTEGSA